MNKLAIVSATSHATVCNGYANAYGDLRAACVELGVPVSRWTAPTLDVAVHLALTRSDADRFLLVHPMVEFEAKDALRMLALEARLVGIGVPRPRYEWEIVRGSCPEQGQEVNLEALATIPQVEIGTVTVPHDGGLLPVVSIEPHLLAVDRGVFEEISARHTDAQVVSFAQLIEYELATFFFGVTGHMAETAGQRFCRLAREAGIQPYLYVGSKDRVANANLWEVNCFRGNVGVLVDP